MLDFVDILCDKVDKNTPLMYNIFTILERSVYMKKVKLYNVVFPIWLLYFFPSLFWLAIIPANFLVDSLVLWLACRWQKLENKAEIFKKSIIKIWILGFVCDFLGAALGFGLLFALSLSGTELGGADILMAIPAAAAAGVLIYFANKLISFRKSGLDAKTVHKICLALAIFTAPYTMLIPAFV